MADGIDRSVEFRQTAPGGYAAAAACPPQAPAAVAIRDEGGATVWRGSAAALCPPEYRQLGADREGLQRLARTTGGRIVTLAELPGALQASYSRRFTELWPWLLGAAAALMLVEWSFARITRR